MTLSWSSLLVLGLQLASLAICLLGSSRDTQISVNCMPATAQSHICPVTVLSIFISFAKMKGQWANGCELHAVQTTAFLEDSVDLQEI